MAKPTEDPPSVGVRGGATMVTGAPKRAKVSVAVVVVAPRGTLAKPGRVGDDGRTSPPVDRVKRACTRRPLWSTHTVVGPWVSTEAGMAVCVHGCRVASVTR